jgi:hypothetical protein
MRYGFRSLLLGVALLISGCVFGRWTYATAGGGLDTAVGEEHIVNYPVADTYALVQDVLRGEGVLFEVEPEYSLNTLWKNADNPPGVFGGLVGVQPRYRYEIRVLPEGSNSSKVIANVRAEDVPDDQVALYKAGRRLDIFNKLDQLAAKLPPGPKTPTSGGVNYALLPNETLEGLAKRVTGNADSWREIAKDNGIASPSDIAAFQTVWVRSDLIKSKPKPPPAPRPE